MISQKNFQEDGNLSSLISIIIISVGINLQILKHCCGIGTVHAESGLPCSNYRTPFPNVPKSDENSCLKPLDVCCKNKFRENQCKLGQDDAMNGRECLGAASDDTRKVKREGFP